MIAGTGASARAASGTWNVPLTTVIGAEPSIIPAKSIGDLLWKRMAPVSVPVSTEAGGSAGVIA